MPRSNCAQRIDVIKYCDDANALISLKLTYTNNRSKNLILNRYMTIIRGFRIAKTLKQLKSGVLEIEGSTEVEFAGSPRVTDLPDSTYEIIPPNQAFTVTTEHKISVGIQSPDDEQCDEDCLKPGQHVLQITVSSSSLSKDLATELGSKWKSEGELFTQGLTSVPLEFTIDAPRARKYVNCNS